jgi:GNAT superfamily N-acetyltransferase
MLACILDGAYKMTVSAIKTKLKSILPLRALFLQEMNTQIRYNACHERGHSDSYLLTMDDIRVGYGSVKGRDGPARDAVFEFFVIRPFRKHVAFLFQELLAASGAAHVECQSNDKLLSSLLHERSSNISADVILFEDHVVTEHVVPGAIIRPKQRKDRPFDHTMEPVGDHVALFEGEVVATGGFLCHYNPPFADLYMEVREDRRKRGIGSFLLQEVKKACYLAGRVPAARCDAQNGASRATLLKAGMRESGSMLRGEVIAVSS